jgi:uncharacterized repeat protein (TIGR02543 family)
MRRVVGWGLLVLALAMVLGVGSASGRTLAVPSTVTVQVIGPGKVKSSPDSEINCGNGKVGCYAAYSTDPITLTAVDQDDWHFDHWDGDCFGQGNPCTLAVDGTHHDYDATAYFSGPPTGTSTLTVTYSGQGRVNGGLIDCSTLGDPPVTTNGCTWSVLTGSTLTVHQAPDTSVSPGWVFAGWGGACQDTDDACTIDMDANKTLSANWVESSDVSNLSVTISGSGRVEGGGITCHGPGSCTEQESTNSTVVLQATPDDGFQFTGWSGTACSGTSDQCHLTMNGDKSVTATFAPLPKLTVTVDGNGNVSGGTGAINCGNGGIICSGTFTLNATVTLIATPATGATFTGWTGACGGSGTTCTVLMNQSRNVTATFAGGTPGGTGSGFLLTVSVSGLGSVTGSGINCGNGGTTCTATPAANATVTLTATPAAGATFVGWGGSCSGSIPTCSVLMTAARSVTASFSSGGGTTSVLLSVSVTGGGTVSGGGINCGNGATGCSANLPTGSAVTLTATPAPGASFSGWTGACTGTSPTCTVTMNVAKSVNANFTVVAPGTLVITVKGKGTVSAPAGKCVGTVTTRTCIQKYAAGRKVLLTASAAAGNTFAGWGDACVSAGKRINCALTLSTGKSATAAFLPATAGGGGGGGTTGKQVLTSLGRPLVAHTAAGWRVILRFHSTRAGVARVVGLRAGRVGARVTFRIASGPARIGPFTVKLPGLYTFQVRLGTALLQWRVCLGKCGARATAQPFVLIRKPPTVTRSGDVWSVTLHVHSNRISIARVRAVKNSKALVDQRFLAKAGEISIGPFLLGPGNYTLRLNATDAYGRTRSLSWVVALAP